ncbi:hypothetical protein BH09PSE6_BH09PSE6_24530 [soil metagenome]
MDNYYDGLNLKLLDAIPRDSMRVLELGCANGRLGRRFKELSPLTEWWGVDINEAACTAASAVLDRAFLLDIDRDGLAAVGRGFDVIVIGDLLEHLRDPQRLLESLYDLATPDARIVCCLPNMTHLSVIERMVAGDISYDAAGLLDATHTRFFSPSSAFKTFLDGGWLPHLQDQYRSEIQPTAFAAQMVKAAEALGVPRETAIQNFGLYQMILVARKWEMQALAGPGQPVPFSVIVPVNRPWQMELNVARSPGLLEVGAEVIRVQGAADAASAYRMGASKAKHDWRLFVHQDVYFPTGSGYAIARELGALQAAGQVESPVGFAGLAGGGSAKPRYAGMVIDRKSLFDHPETDCAVSIDEFAVALHREATTALDPTLGWHLWATDLCLQAMASAGRPTARIARVPLFHNSTLGHSLPAAFHESARILLDKHEGFDSIATLCGALSRGPLNTSLAA